MSIFLDFDGTITTEDTVSHLANFALRFQSERRPETGGSRQGGTATDASGGPDLPSPSPSLPARWAEVVRAYLSDHASHASAYAPRAPDRRCAADEIAFLRSQKHVETASLRRVRECALFRGISGDVFREAGRALVRDGTVRLRPGFADFVRAARARGWRVHVVSVNWSAAFIEGACGFDEEGREAEEEEEGKFAVFANEVCQDDGAVLGPGVLAGDSLLVTAGGDGDPSREPAGRNLTNSCDKRDAVREVMRRHGLQDKPFYYFGDSTTDMECLLEATRGVVVADDEKSTLIETLRRIGKRVPHVRDAEPGDELVWASNFEEVMRSTFSP